MHVTGYDTGTVGLCVSCWVACVAGQACDGAEPGGLALPASAALQVWGLGQGETRQGKATHTGRGGGMDAILCV